MIFTHPFFLIKTNYNISIFIYNCLRNLCLLRREKSFIYCVIVSMRIKLYARCSFIHIRLNKIWLLIFIVFFLRYLVFWLWYRVTHKGCDFSDDLKLLKSSKFIGVSVFTFCLTLVDIYKKYWEQKYSQWPVAIHRIC